MRFCGLLSSDELVESSGCLVVSDCSVENLRFRDSSASDELTESFGRPGTSGRPGKNLRFHLLPLSDGLPASSLFSGFSKKPYRPISIAPLFIQINLKTYNPFLNHNTLNSNQ
jgi:hypothetical protein